MKKILIAILGTLLLSHEPAIALLVECQCPFHPEESISSCSHSFSPGAHTASPQDREKLGVAAAFLEGLFKAWNDPSRTREDKSSARLSAISYMRRQNIFEALCCRVFGAGQDPEDEGSDVCVAENLFDGRAFSKDDFPDEEPNSTPVSRSTPFRSASSTPKDSPRNPTTPSRDTEEPTSRSDKLGSHDETETASSQPKARVVSDEPRTFGGPVESCDLFPEYLDRNSDGSLKGNRVYDVRVVAYEFEVGGEKQTRWVPAKPDESGSICKTILTDDKGQIMGEVVPGIMNTYPDGRKMFRRSVAKGWMLGQKGERAYMNHFPGRKTLTDGNGETLGIPWLKSGCNCPEVNREDNLFSMFIMQPGSDRVGEVVFRQGEDGQVHRLDMLAESLAETGEKNSPKRSLAEDGERLAGDNSDDKDEPGVINEPDEKPSIAATKPIPAEEGTKPKPVASTKQEPIPPARAPAKHEPEPSSAPTVERPNEENKPVSAPFKFTLEQQVPPLGAWLLPSAEGLGLNHPAMLEAAGKCTPGICYPASRKKTPETKKEKGK